MRNKYIGRAMLCEILNLAVLLGLAIVTVGCKHDRLSEPVVNTPIVNHNIFECEGLTASADFEGARLNNLVKVNDSTFNAHFNPENEPINNSAWYCFQMWSKHPQQVTLNFHYPEDYNHRYIPKYSHDGKTWEAFDESHYRIDSAGDFRLKVSVNQDKLWISAQENLNNQYVSDWLEELATQDNVALSQIGLSVEERPLQLLHIRESSPKFGLVMVGRQHPPEVPGGTISLMAFVEELLSETELANDFRQRFEVLAFPLLNPDGVQHGHWRHNANGQDLNRDWVGFSQPETQAVRDYLKDHNSSQLAFGIDFHTSFSGPYLLTLDSIPHTVKPIITKAWIANISAQTGDSLDIRPRAQGLPYCYNWFINELGVEAVTYEEGDEIDREVIRRRAQIYARTLMEELMNHFE